MAVETGFAEVDDGRLYYEIAGTGPPLVFLHGFTLDTRMWDDQFAHFADRHRVLRYDMRGFGRSTLPTEAPFSNHDDLRALLDHHGIDRAHLCGLSSGGGTAIDLALEDPGRVLSLVLISSALGGVPGVGSMGPTVAAMYAAGAAGDLTGARKLWVGSALFAPATRDPGVAGRLRDMVDTWSGWHLTHEANHVDPDPVPAGRLATLVAPTLLMTGELDEVPPMIAAKIEDEAPEAHHVVVPDVGHMANMEAPDVVNGHIARFLAGLDH